MTIMLCKYNIKVLIGFICGIASSIFSAYVPLLYSKIIELLLENSDKIEVYVVQYLIYKIVGNIFASVRGCMFTLYIHGMTSVRKILILEKLGCMNMLYFDSKKVTDNVEIITHHCEKISELYMLNGNIGVRTFIQTVSIIYVVYNLSKDMFYFIVLICILNIMIQHLYHGYFYNEAIKRRNEKQVEQNRLVTDYITKIDSYRGSGMGKKMYSKFSLYQNEIDERKVREAIHYSINMFISQSINSLCFCGCVLYGLYIGLRCKDIHMFIMYMDSILSIVDSVKQMYYHVLNNYVSLEKVRNLLEYEKVDNWGDMIIVNFHPTITVSNLYFSYKDELILSNISLSILYGDRIGISGSSGKGKSTFLKLLIGMYSICKGSIKYDKIGIREFERDWFYEHIISYVSQELSLLYYKDDNNLDFLDTFGDFAKDIPRDNPSNMSGGQKQRLSICEALNKKSSIIVMDEPTASLDDKNIELLIELLKKEKRTLIVVSHNIEFLKKTCYKIEYW